MTGKLTFTSIAFAVGVVTSAAVSALVPENQWKGFHWMFVFPAALLNERVFGAQFASAHRALTYGTAAVFHGVVLALFLLLILVFASRLRLKGAVLTLGLLVVIDVVLLLFVSPMRELP